MTHLCYSFSGSRKAVISGVSDIDGTLKERNYFRAILLIFIHAEL